MKRIATVLIIVLLMQTVSAVGLDNVYVYSMEINDIHINFQDSESTTPGDYLPDIGEAYGNRGEYTYGWNQDHSNNGVVWPEQADEALATGLFLNQNSVWELKLNNGIYEVTLGVYSEEEKNIALSVEDKSYWDQRQIEANELLEKTCSIEVTDGKLTLYAETDDTLISYISVVPSSVIIEEEEPIEEPDIETEEEQEEEVIEETEPEEEEPVEEPDVETEEEQEEDIEETEPEEEEPVEEPDIETEEEQEEEDIEETEPEEEEPVEEPDIETEEEQEEDIEETEPEEEEPVEALDIEIEEDSQPDEDPKEIDKQLDVLVKMYNANRASENNTIYPWFQVVNSGEEVILLKDVKIRYYYTIDGERDQQFFCDWSNIGSGKISGDFVKMEQPWEGANYYLEISFEESAGSLLQEETVEIHGRIAKLDWSNYTQTDDYSFNQNDTTYEEWDKVTLHYKEDLIWGEKGTENEPEPIPTEPELTLRMFNSNRNEISNTLFIRYELENTGQLPVDFNDIKIQYFYTVDGNKPQNYFVDWSTIGASNVLGELIELEEPLDGADHLYQIGFQEDAGVLEPEEKIEIHSRVAKSDWSNFNQYNDYSFNSEANKYQQWEKVILLLNNEIISGEESEVLPPPQEPEEPQQPIKIQMYNAQRNMTTNTIFPWFRIYNTTSSPIELEDTIVRYFFTTDGEEQLNYYVDWSNVGASNIKGKFSELAKPRTNGDHYFEIGFESSAGSLASGEYVEIHTRLAKNDWSNFDQSNDFSFNPDSNRYEDWTKVNGYYEGFFVWGEADFFDIPEGLTAVATETTVNLEWEPVETAALYDVEVDGEIISVDSEGSYLHEGLLPGTMHTYRVRAKTSTVTGGWSESLEVFTIPGVPQGLQAHSTSESVNLSWDPVPGALGYEVEIYGEPIDVGSSLSYNHTDLNPNTQTTYRVRAKNESGIGQWSSIIAHSTLPAVPSGLKGNASSNSVTVTWNSTPGTSTYDLEVDGSILEGLTQPSFQHANLNQNEVHQYRVRASNALGTSQWSDLIIVQTLPETPKNLTGIATQNQISLSWDCVEGATAYDIQADGVTIEDITLPEYTHVDLAPDSKHAYRVRAKNNSIVGQWSELVTLTTLLDGEIIVYANPSSSQIELTWNMVAGALSYDVEVDGVIIDNGLNTAYTHKDLLPNTTHTYRVRVRSEGGFGQWSEAVTAKTIFGTPQNLQAIADRSSIVLTWQGVDGATGYDVFADGEVFDNKGDTSYHHSGLEPYSWHVYRVRAKGDGIIGEWSPPITIPTLIGTPQNLKGKAESNQISLDWDSVAHASYYEIEVDGKIIKSTSSSSFTHEGLEVNKLYTYRIRAIVEDERPEWSNISRWSRSLEIATLPGPPTNLKAEANTHSITLTWDHMEGASSYDVEVDGIVEEGITTASYTVDGLKPNTYHSFKVRVHDGDTLSEWSEVLEKNTLPELTIQVAKDNLFHFVVVAPPKADESPLTITVTYDSEAVQVLDLSANTPEVILETGNIPGTNITVTEFSTGKIVYQVDGADKTTVNSIQFLSLSNEDSKITYRIE
ncbi:hypothetical protein F8154_06620 [Alkaliphilus pronyensis]|uniref:Uncharacterized protein n=1 Tax=Alkaliphilus pronyensis TaxID=1482732 RepID=A0A6I0F2C3_9FIRM|nr:cellulose binding domain-containing protein [Alkaliphilus pronyensis]KAB3535452.1 hypothetical protein F8154_06620 [Alkaliphilus pronyensis]